MLLVASFLFLCLSSMHDEPPEAEKLSSSFVTM